jgi:selenide,water dikinase
MSAEALAHVLRPLDGIFTPSPDLLTGVGDDAALWRLDADRALVVTTDFFTPVVDTPYEYGAIAAANSLSDVYAMGGQPFLALNIANMPGNLPHEIVSEILRGGAEKVKEAGAIIAGGHTIQDEEPKYGLVVLGFVHPEKALTKGGARPGDVLILTKPLGFGVTTTALKRGAAAPDHITEAIGWMSRLNAGAAQLAREFALRGGTDITGFSLLGHGWEMAHASGVGFRLSFSQIPFLSCARIYAERGTFPGGSADNRMHFGPHVTFPPDLDEPAQMLLFDAQTSGGLLLAVPHEKVDDLLTRAKEIDQPAWVIGEVVEGEGIEVLK